MKTLTHKPLIAFAVVCIGLMLLPQPVREWLFLDIKNYHAGEYSRFFTAHFIHYSWIHCLSNILGLLLLVGIFSHTKQVMHWYLAAAIACISISSGLILFSEQLNWYVGFSGILTGLYAYASIKTLNENWLISTIILVALSAFIIFQLREGELVKALLIADLSASSYAHAYGFIAGVLYALIDQCIVYKYIDHRNKHKS